MQDSDALADMVILTVKSALAPVLERLAVSEQSNRDLRERVLELLALRDRVTTMEVKGSIQVAEPKPELVVDLAPLHKHLEAIDAKVALLDAPHPADATDMAAVLERVSGLEVRATALEGRPEPQAVDLSPALASIADLKKDVGLLRERDITAVVDRVSGVESRLKESELRAEIKGSELAPVAAAVADLTKDAGAMRERVAVMEVRAQIPGPAGKDGADGKEGAHGLNGKDGSDGLGWDDLEAVQEDERTFTLKASRGERVKAIGTVRFPVQIQQGVYVDGKSYTKGDVVTWGGSQFHCNEDTTAKPETSKAWTLIVKRGRDGKDGRDGTPPVPVVKVP